MQRRLALMTRRAERPAEVTAPNSERWMLMRGSYLKTKSPRCVNKHWLTFLMCKDVQYYGWIGLKLIIWKISDATHTHARLIQYTFWFKASFSPAMMLSNLIAHVLSAFHHTTSSFEEEETRIPRSLQVSFILCLIKLTAILKLKMLEWRTFSCAQAQ